MPLYRWRSAMCFRPGPGTVRSQPEQERLVIAADNLGAAGRDVRNSLASRMHYLGVLTSSE